MAQAIGIDFGGTSIKSGVVENGRIVAYGESIDTRNHDSPESLVEALLLTVETLRRGRPEVGAIGIGLPGLVDSKNGIVHELTNVSGWRDVALRALVRERTGLPSTIENDANAMAYGEFRYGAAKDARHVVCVTLGTGVGGALILDGRLYRGAQLGAGEIGHVSIDFRGRPGPYGNFGGLEEYVGNQQIAERAALAYGEAGEPRSMEDCTPQALEAAARQADPVALKIWEEVGDEIGSALASVIWLINPDAIVIGGGVAKAGPFLFEPLRRSVQSRTAKVFSEKLRIIPAALGNEAGIIGGAILALEAAAEERMTVL